MMGLAGGSFGLQLGGQATDFVLFVMNPRGASAMLSSQVKLGADASAADRTTNSPRRRMSSEDAPIITRKAPGSTIHRMAASSICKSRGPSVNATSRDSPGASRTREKPLNSMTGLATDARTSRR
jgi:hypothetical protein